MCLWRRLTLVPTSAPSADRSLVHKEALKQIRDIIGAAAPLSDAQLLTVYRQNALDVERTVDALLALDADGQSFPDIPLSPPPSTSTSTSTSSALNRSNGALPSPVLRHSRGAASALRRSAFPCCLTALILTALFLSEPSVFARIPDPSLARRREERAEQDREYEQSLRLDQEKARLRTNESPKVNLNLKSYQSGFNI